MRIHIDPQQRESLGRPVAVSLSCHAALLATALFWSIFIHEAPFRFGDPFGVEGGAVAVSVVDGVPLNVSRRRRNPVANPVVHEVPAPKDLPKPTAPEPAPDDPEAVPVEPSRRRKSARPEPAEKARKSAPERPRNQVVSSTGAAVSDPLFSGQQQLGGGGIGYGKGTPFGQGYGWYSAALQRRLSEQWRKTLGQVSGTSSKPVVVSFRILRNGRVDRIRVVESSGNRSLDYSAHRSVVNANPFRPLPAGLRKSSIIVEMYFRLN